MFDVTISKQFSAAGKSFSHSQTISAPHVEAVEETIAVAQDASLTTRTSNTAGTLTMVNSSHGITTASHIDLYWLDADGVTWHFAHNALVGSVSGTSVPFSGAGGENMPAADSDIIAALVNTFSIDITGNNVAALLMGTDFAACQIVLIDSGGPTNLIIAPIQPNACYEYCGEFTNPLAGDTVDTVHMSHADINAVHSVRVVAALTA
jgi:hypothetical protein